MKTIIEHLATLSFFLLILVLIWVVGEILRRFL